MTDATVHTFDERNIRGRGRDRMFAVTDDQQNVREVFGCDDFAALYAAQKAA